jgi:arginyl-tRNA synthetase
LKTHLEQLLHTAVARLQQRGIVPADAHPAIQLYRTRDERHGHFASNLALTLAKSLAGTPDEGRRKPRDLAELMVAELPASDEVDRVEVAGAGFINFHLTPKAFQGVVRDILEAGPDYGRSQLGKGQRVCVEFVSANPTGPLHVGHGRGAAYGEAVAALLQAAGYQVHREYYVNDAGRQMDILAVSVWLRYLELCGEAIPFPANGYQGDYVYDIAAHLHRENGEAFDEPATAVLEGLPPDASEGGDKEVYIDALIARAKELLDDAYAQVHAAGLHTLLEDIRKDLEAFGVVYDQWFSERSLLESNAVGRTIRLLQERGHVYQKDGALWFRSSALGDEKDRVLVRENGQLTYFASDIAYHLNKRERGFQRLIDVWGADHHGYVARVKAALQAAGDDPGVLEVLLVQFAVLYRGGERVQMSTRSGEFVTLRELRQEVGRDAARFFYVMRKSDQHLDFDLDLAKSQSTDNPVYYVQYAHARISSVMVQLQERGLAWDRDNGLVHLDRLTEPHEQSLLRSLSRYPEVIEIAAKSYEPHQIAQYLRELANDFHVYYNAHTFLVEDAALRDARLALVLATQQVLRHGLGLLGVSAPERM